MKETRFRAILSKEGYKKKDIDGIWKHWQRYFAADEGGEDSLRLVARAFKPIICIKPLHLPKYLPK